MSDTENKVKRGQIGLEDISFGTGTEMQERDGLMVPITRINGQNWPIKVAQGPQGNVGPRGEGVPTGGNQGDILQRGTGTTNTWISADTLRDAISLDLSTADATWRNTPDDYVPNVDNVTLKPYILRPPNLLSEGLPTGWSTDGTYILFVYISRVGTTTDSWLIHQRIEDYANGRLAYRTGEINAGQPVTSPAQWTTWTAVAGSGGSSNLTATLPLEITNNNISITSQGRNPYQFFWQSKDITAPSLVVGTNDRITATGDGSVLQLIPKFTPDANTAGVAIVNRNFETEPEGFVNFSITSTATRLDAALRTTHFFSEVDATVPNLVTDERVEIIELVTGENSIALSDFLSNVVLTSSSTGSALAGRAVPISVEIVLKAYAGGQRVVGTLTSLTYNKVGITFKQLADRIGERGERGRDGTDGATTFVALTDTPNTVTPGQYLRGNAAGTGLEYATVSGGSNVPDARLLPSTGGAAGRYVVDVFMNGQITPEWRDRIIPWTGQSGGNHGNSQGFQIGDIIRYPNTGQNQNIYIVESAIAPGTDFASLAENAVRRLTGRGVASIGFNNGNRTFTLTRDDGTTETVTIPGGGSGGGTTFTIPAGQPIELTASNNLVFHEDDITLEVATVNSRDSLQIKNAGVSTAKIADSAVTTAKIGADAVDGTKIADNAVNSEHIASRAVTTAKLDNSITQAIDANTAKRSFPADDEAKLDGIAPGATVGATTAQQQAITANTAKRSYPQADQTKLATVATGATVGATAAQEARITANDAKTSAEGNDLTGQPTFASGTLTLPKRTGAPYTVTIPTGSGGGNNIRDILFNTATTIPNNAGSSGWPTGTNLSLQTGKTFANWDVIFVELEIDSGVSLGGGGVNRFSLTIDGATFRATTSSTRMVQRGSNETTAGYNLGIYNNPNTGETADTSSRFNVAGLGGANARIISIVGAQYRGQTGATGPQGATGQTGPQGNPGTPGQDGAPGQDGQDGTAATIAVGTTTTSNPGTNATVTNSGNANAAVFDFAIPRGATGATGPQGATGQTGPQGNPGTPGTNGQDGAAATITVGTTTTGNPGTNASVTNSGNANQATFDFVIPRGATGAQGATGQTGPQGNPGQDGAAATIAVGTVTTGAAGSNATVTNSGTSAAAVFDFTIPQGAQGTPGTGGSTTEIEISTGVDADRAYPSTNGISYYGVSTNIPTGVTAGILRSVRGGVRVNQHLQATIGTNANKIYVRNSTDTGNTWSTWTEVGEGTGITPQQAAAIVANTAKVGLYAQHATAVGVWTGVAGNPGDSTVIASGTTQFDSNDVYLSRTTSEGLAISTTDLPSAGQPINFAGYPGTVGSISQNSNRIKITINYTGNTPIANDGHKFQLFNVADPSIAEHGIYTKGALEGTGDPADKADVRDGGITSAKLDLASGDTITAGQAVVYRANGEFGSAPLGQGGGGTPANDSVGRDQLDFVAGTVETNGRLVALTTTGELTTVTGASQPTSTFGHDTLITPTAVTSKLNHTQNLDTNKVLTGHDAFLISFRYTHNITLSGHTFQSHNIWSKVYDGNDFRASAGGRQYFEEVFLEGQSTAHNVVFIVARNSDTSITISFTDTTATSASAATIDQFELVGIRYGGAASANATSINGLPVPAFPSS